MGVEDSKLRISNQESSIYQYDEWTELLHYIYEKRYSPFIGSEAHVRWIPSNNNIAIKWAEEEEILTLFIDLKTIAESNIHIPHDSICGRYTSSGNS